MATIKKNANGKGSTYPRKDGRWVATFPADPDTGKPMSTPVYGASEEIATGNRDGVLARLREGLPARDAKITVGDWTRQWREVGLPASDRAVNTRSQYASLLRNHVECKALGRVRLDQIKPSHIDAMLVEAKQNLALSSVRSLYAALRAALDGAVRDGLLGLNPMLKVKRPANPPRKRVLSLPPLTVFSLLEEMKTSRYHNAMLFLANTGLRRGEVLALKWSQINFARGTRDVIETLYRAESRLQLGPVKNRRLRTISLTPELVALLNVHRQAQREERLAAPVWEENDFVFTTGTGTACEPRNVNRVMTRAATALGIKSHPHVLRHSFATTMLDAGYGIKVVSDALGHSSISITGDIYTDVPDTTAVAAMSAVGRALGM